MKKLLSFILVMIICYTLTAQITYNPSCYSNTAAVVINSITQTDYNTQVEISYKRSHNTRFFINPGMYIQQSSSGYSPKYIIKNVLNGELNTFYYPEGNTEYTLTLVFDRIPNDWANIDIIEPSDKEGFTGWYWKDITLNLSSDRRMKIDHFIKNVGANLVASLAHPTNTVKSIRYAIDYNTIYLDVYYYSDYYTELKISKDGDYFKNITLRSENDFPPAFSAIELSKDLIYKYVNTDYVPEKDWEKIIDKAITDMTGSDMACISLTAAWLGYK